MTNKVQSVYHFCRGVRLVSTNSYSVLFVSRGFAEKYIPKTILDKIPFASTCYQFENDYSILLFFCPFLLYDVVEAFHPGKSAEETVRYIKNYSRNVIANISERYPHFLAEYPLALQALYDFEKL